MPSRADAPIPPLVRPWWREPMMWLVLGGPALVVVASLVTGAVAWHTADTVVLDTLAGPAEAQPAMKARNHAATPR